MPLDISPWTSFGLPGMVIGALFLTLWAIGKSILLKILDMQREERKEWREAVVNMTTETNAVIRELTAVVQDMNGRSRKYQDHL